MYESGTVVAGKYRIERVLGQGGMGYVVAATHLDLGTPVALKFLHPHMLENRDVVDRFKREARASAQLRGENVCRVSDVGTAENGQPFMVMELLQGQDLNTMLRERGPMQPMVVAEIMLQACLALAEAHMIGIVHRDVKPGNLMLTTRPDGTMCIKVLDFGVAKAPDAQDFSLTQTSSVVGSPGYMSPEQLKSSKGATVRSDIWSLGIVMYELVTGVKPWQGESITELALKVALEPPPPLAGRVPWEFEAVVMLCLEKEPAKRYQDVADLAVALAPFAGPRGPEMARAVARVLRGAHTPVPVTPASSLQTHSMPVAIPRVEGPPTPAPTSTPTTLRQATGVVGPSPSQVTSMSKKSPWKLPLIMGGGAAVGIALALLIVSHGKKHAAPAKQETETETHEMQSSPTPDPAASATAKPADTAPAVDTKTQDDAAKQAAVADDKKAAELAKKEAAEKALEDKKAAELAKREAAAKAADDKKAAELARKEAAAKAADDKKAAELAKKEEAAKAAADKKAADLAKREAAKEEAAKLAAEKKAKRDAARAEAAKLAAEKAAAAKTSHASTTKTTKMTTTKTTTTKDVGDSRQ